MHNLNNLLAGDLDLGALENVSTPNLPNATVGSILNALVGDYLFRIAGFVFLGMLVVGGYQYMTSYGDPKKVTSGKEKITYGLIGFIVIFSAYWLVRIVGRILDIQAIQDIFGA